MHVICQKYFYDLQKNTFTLYSLKSSIKNFFLKLYVHKTQHNSLFLSINNDFYNTVNRYIGKQHICIYRRSFLIQAKIIFILSKYTDSLINHNQLKFLLCENKIFQKKNQESFSLFCNVNASYFQKTHGLSFNVMVILLLN